MAKSVDTTRTPMTGVAPYVHGFLFAVTLTLLAYFMVVNHWLSGGVLTLAIMGLASVQLIVQLVFFLHLGRGEGSRWKVASFFFMLLVLLIIVVGSLWIMENLNYNMQMTPEQMTEFMRKQADKGF